VWKWLLGVFLAFVLVCGGGGFLFAKSPQGKEMIAKMKGGGGKPTEVRIGKVVRGELVRTVNAPGQIEPKTKVEISAQVSARIVALPYRAGAIVKKGDVVCRLDSVDLAASVDSAKASLKGREADLDAARANFQESERQVIRARQLWETKDISKSELDAAETSFLRSGAQMRQAEFSIDIAKANIVRAEKDLANTVIIAPFDGTITKLDAEIGELVVVGTLNNPGSVFMEISDLNTMLMKARVDESNIQPIKVGQRATIFINAFGEKKFAGVTQFVDLARKVDTDRTPYFEVEILIDNDHGELLRTGLNSNCEIQVESFPGSMQIASQAVVDRRVDELPKDVVKDNPNIDPAKTFAKVVYVIKDGKSWPIPVSTGASDLTKTIIIRGLDEGQPVITGPFKVLVDLKHDKAVAEEGTLKKDEKKEPATATASSDANGKS
jgi:HlyD family secretion protein